IFFAPDRRNATLDAHLGSGERGVFVADGFITLATGKEETGLCRLSDVPLIGEGQQPEDVAAVLAAVAAGWALDLTDEVIVTGIKTYGLELPEPAVARA